MIQTIGEWWMWLSFALFVVAAVVVDLVVMRAQGAHKVSVREAGLWSFIWFTLSFIFCGLLWWYLERTAGHEVATLKTSEFLTGYLIEKSLSVDNVFVFFMIFNYFAVPSEYQKRILILGVIGAIVLRAIMILLGGLLIQKFHWILYFFGAFLAITGIKMLLFADEKPDLEKNPILRWIRGHLKISHSFRGELLTYKDNGVRWYTPLFIVVIMIGVTDIIFAVDSIPAIFAITEDPFIVLTANLFAILGLRALYFLLADMADRFHYLAYGLALVLIFVGAKMLFADLYKVPVAWSLATVVLVLLASVLLSWLRPKTEA
jgi:tellurite resistance protein TerC